MQAGRKAGEQAAASGSINLVASVQARVARDVDVVLRPPNTSSSVGGDV